MTTEDVLLVERHAGVATVTLSRPHVKNALNRALITALAATLEALGTDTAVRALVLTGAGGAFCSGADLKSDLGEDPDFMAHLEERVESFHRVVKAIIAADKPVLAAVDGAAVGFGANLALACDLRLVTPESYFQQSFTKLGLMPDGGGTFWLPRLVGLGKAFELIYGAERVSGADAVAMGLANRLSTQATLQGDAATWADKLAKGPPIAHAKLRAALWQNLSATPFEALDREKEGQVQCLRTGDVMEGVLSWMQRRPPEFKGQ